MRLAAFAVLLAAGAAAGAAIAHSDNDFVKARQAYFTLLGANTGPLAAMAKGEIDYDAATAELHAANLAEMAAYNPTPHFPAGTAKEDLPGETRALASIWSDMDGFMERVAQFNEAVDALQGAAGAGRGELGQAVGRLGASCKACHDDYRAADF